jgi:hypothetical protein
MKKFALSLAGLLVLAGCTPQVDDDVINQMENAVREGLAEQGTVKQVELNRENENRMTGYALVEPRNAPGTELRFSCTADREGDTGSRFNWRCTPPSQQQQAASEGAGAEASGDKDPQAAAPADTGGGAGPGRMALVGRWTDVGDCSNVTLLGEDGVFIAPNGNRGNWALQGSQLTLSGPGGSVSWAVFLQDPNTLVLTSPDGSRSQSTRC